MNWCAQQKGLINIKFPVKSATYAMKGKQVLLQEGIRSSVGKSSDETGCYYFLKVADRLGADAQRILSENNVLK